MRATGKPASRPEAGDSLVEILVAVGIITVALTALIAALSTGMLGVRTANRVTVANTLAVNQLEAIKAAPYDPAGAYPLVSAPAGYTITLASRTLAAGLQQVTVTVSYEGGAVVIGNYKVDR